ncbi:hypothetical protein [Methylocella sp.]|uniref:hypothetical protein n=1 Tax=Methylocella sp. TaxID=1978226 RepID=UPI003783636D
MRPDLSPFMRLRRHVAIAHHVPGRIRLKLALGALAELPAVDPAPFVGLIDRLRGVNAVRVNAAALSVVVEYDPAVVDMADWPRLLSGAPEDAERILASYIS